MEDLYTVEEGIAFSLEGTHTLWGSPRRNGFVHVPGALVEACQHLQGARTLSQFADVLTARVVGLGAPDARSLVDALVGANLLRPASIGPRDGSPHLHISSVAIITRDRPLLLGRCLASLRPHCGTDQEVKRILVVDGSTDPAVIESNVTVLGERPADGPLLNHVPRSSIAQFCSALAKSPDEEALLQFALAKGSAGANRNVVTLLTAGEAVAMCDDDILWKTFQTPARSAATRVFGHAEPWDVGYFPTRKQAVDAVVRRSLNLVAALDDVLGQSIRDVVHRAGDELDLDHACPHLLGALGSPHVYRIAAAYPGIVGDSGQECHQRLLLGSSAATQAALRDEDCCRTALGFREIVRVAANLTIAHVPWCMSGTVGLDNTTMSVPFLPLGRGEDGLFATMTAWCDPFSLVAHLPIAVLHDSTRTSAFDRVSPVATSTSTSELIQLLISTAVIPPYAGTPALRLRILGQLLAGVASLPAAAFEECIRERILQARIAQLEVARDRLDGVDYVPPFWQDAVEQYVTTLLTAMQARTFWLPYDCGPEAGLEQLRHTIARFAAMCDLWPEW